jgi:putative 4-mercaptohistidine N1-methyltranferase
VSAATGKATPYYDSDRAVSEYLLFHYGTDNQVLPWPFGPRDAVGFPVRCVTECVVRDLLPVRARGLDMGCAVGRSSFELARFADVIAIDASARFITAARELQARGALEFEVPVEGSMAMRIRVVRPPGVDPARVTFEVGDALQPRADLGSFDVVLAANLIDRVPRPRALVAELAARVAHGGQLILTSPYTWLEEYTPREEWLTHTGQSSMDVLAVLLRGFVRVRRMDLPFLIREHARKYQWSVAEATVWHRVAPHLKGDPA